MAKLSQQQERFARNIIEGMNQTDAYKAAGYKCANDNVAAVNASNLIRNPKIAAAIEQGRQKAAEATEVTLEWLINESVSLYRQAKREGAHAAANATLKTIGVYTSHWNEKSTRTNINTDAADLTEAELAAIASGGSARAAGPQDSAAQPRKIH